MNTTKMWRCINLVFVGVGESLSQTDGRESQKMDRSKKTWRKIIDELVFMAMVGLIAYAFSYGLFQGYSWCSQSCQCRVGINVSIPFQERIEIESMFGISADPINTLVEDRVSQSYYETDQSKQPNNWSQILLDREVLQR
jgi:hypothetical protein